MIYFCCEEKRRSAVRAFAPLPGKDDINGIEYLEVVDHDEPIVAERQRTLRVVFVKTPAKPLADALAALTPANIRITGGVRVMGIVADDVTVTPDGHLEVHVTQSGDFSPYTLALIDLTNGGPLRGLDPVLSSIDFSFKVECPSPFDCATDCQCAPEVESPPEVDYLAKDYASFRQLMLDRMSLLAPSWRERNPADIGITLVELFAYVGDYLSYRQDAIATEAYLGTARQRVSVRRHARLLDYAMHDGCNARAWVQVRIKRGAPAAGIALPRFLVFDPGTGTFQPSEAEPVPGQRALLRTRFTTTLPEPTLIDDGSFPRLNAEYRPEVFEPLHDTRLFPEHNELPFYTWSDDDCCLPAGATKATLAGAFPNLDPGDVLVFKEVLGPRTGNPADADWRHRHPVRLTKVNGRVLQPDGTIDETHKITDATDALTGQAITEIEWSVDDALPFALTLSSVTERGTHQRDVSIALGNIVLADHGETIDDVDLGAVPEPASALAPAMSNGCRCDTAERDLAPPRFRPRLTDVPLTQAATITRTQVVGGRRTNLAFDSAGSARSAGEWDLERVRAVIRLGDERGVLWLPKGDLLSSSAFAPEFVAEMENDGRATLRFGDDENGMRPGVGSAFRATYRIGNGTRGNVGADSITHVTAGALAGDAALIDAVSNPLAAAGGVDPETIEQVRQYAPAAFRVPKRAVTPEDYAMIAERHPEVQRAAATLRWTGSWHTMALTIDRIGGRPVDAPFEASLRDHLEVFRMAGHDLEIDGPRYVPLEIVMEVCVAPEYYRSDVLAALRSTFTAGVQPDGTHGVFHPDRFSFGDGVYASRLYAAAMRVAGVRSVAITTLQRLGTPSREALDDGVLRIGRLEIARLDNDPNFSDRGIMTFSVSGGR